ncbi:PREDICTED: uncharacterized protein LOC109585570 [Amphimedon queenslandica]|uniref:Death domain-containing protein n=1 Tax=Amphimedon queenslandica TaxID=400682 RepID=A0A1X7TXT7_AMPQE|nr:PREDICTED: uncharacterized protein LOC109585570 [Amphimedon queenslandica]|eukprot:XP_019857250.1 PREDICTED: uncharacterized protein LOC109585570 [Amphimedon queenslandica]
MAENPEEKAHKKAAKDAISLNTSVLSDALKNDPILRSVVQKCVEKRYLTTAEMDTLFDPYTGQSLAQRASNFVSKIQSLVGILPGKLDEFVCILHETGNPVVQEAARKVAENCTFILPQYEELTSVGSLPAGPLSPRSDSNLSITDLNTVRSALRDGNFKKTKWMDLGEELGLSVNTLDVIEADHNGADRRLRECLVKWLERADEVDDKGGAKWSVLVTALNTLKQKEAADYIKSNYLKN